MRFRGGLGEVRMSYIGVCKASNSKRRGLEEVRMRYIGVCKASDDSK